MGSPPMGIETRLPPISRETNRVCDKAEGSGGLLRHQGGPNRNKTERSPLLAGLMQRKAFPRISSGPVGLERNPEKKKIGKPGLYSAETQKRL